MKDEYDFTKGERGKFFDPEAEFCIPIYLDKESMNFVKQIAAKRQIDVSNVVNDMIKTDKRIAELAQ